MKQKKFTISDAMQCNAMQCNGQDNAGSSLTTKNKERIKEIDIMKAIGISLMVLGHLPIHPEINRLIYAFHMPLFFFISGFTFNNNYGFIKFSIKKFERLYIPFCAYSILLLWINPILYALGVSNNMLTVKDLVIETWHIILFDNGLNPMVYPLWYILVSFAADILFYLCIKINKRFKAETNPLFIGFLLMVIGYIMTKFEVAYFLYNRSRLIECTFTACFFMSCGLFFKKEKMLFVPTLKRIFIATCFFVFGVYQNLSYDPRQNQYSNIVLFTVCALLGIYITYSVAHYISQTKLYQYIENIIVCISQSTFEILAFHRIIYAFIIKAFINKEFYFQYAYDYKIDLSFLNHYHITLLFLCGVAIPTIFSSLFRKNRLIKINSF